MIMNKEFKILQPKYYTRFQCDPSKCQETCCERWKIIIDKSTYEKYIKSENETIKKIVKTGLSINKASVNDDDFAIINLNNELVCPFLNKDGLCEAFINTGEGSLSKTCKSYPRAIVLVKDVIERGLEMSCSVAAELALLNEDGIKFEHVIDTVSFNDLYVVCPLIEDLKEIEIIQEIRITIVEFLQNRTIELSERVAITGYFLDQAIDFIEASELNHEEILYRIKEEKTIINIQEFITKENKHNLQDSRQFHYLNNLLSMKFKEGDSISFFSKRYIECLMQVLDVYGKVKEKELEKQYRRNYEKYLKPYLDKKSYILENFLVNYIFLYDNELFNLSDIQISYLKLCVVYGLIKFNLVGMAAYHKGMKDDLVMKLIQSFSKTFIQDKSYWQAVNKYLEKEKLDEYTKLLMLIED